MKKPPFFPCLAMCNFIQDTDALKAFALEHGFAGIDWSFDLNAIPETPGDATAWVRAVHSLKPLEVRFHCPFMKKDLGHEDPEKAEEAAALFRKIVGLVGKAGGRFLTIHIGLGRDTTEPLSWERTLDNLRRLVQFAAERRVSICLENLAWGWTSKPHLFEKMVRKSGAQVTFDIGHAVVAETVTTSQYRVEDFVTPHADRVRIAHVYHAELDGIGHTPPETIADIEDRLKLLERIGCRFWTIEIREAAPLLHTKQCIDQWLNERAEQEAV